MKSHQLSLRDFLEIIQLCPTSNSRDGFTVKSTKPLALSGVNAYTQHSPVEGIRRTRLNISTLVRDSSWRCRGNWLQSRLMLRSTRSHFSAGVTFGVLMDVRWLFRSSSLLPSVAMIDGVDPVRVENGDRFSGIEL